MVIYENKIKKLTSALNILDITIFFNLRIKRDNKFFVLSNNSNISQFLLNSKNIGFLYDIAAKLTLEKVLTMLWPKNNKDYLLTYLRKLGFDHGISIAVPFNEYVDIFCFATEAKNTHFANFYLNNLKLLKRFIIFFRINVKNIIKQIDHNNLPELNKPFVFEDQNHKSDILEKIIEFRKQVMPRNIKINNNSNTTILTEQETDCLLFLLDGMSLNNIAQELNVPLNSIKSCIENIKYATQCTTHFQLLETFLSNKNYQPSIYND